LIDCDIVKVKVPKAKLMHPSQFSFDENVWYWEYNNSHNLYYDVEEEVRVKVVEVHFNKPLPAETTTTNENHNSNNTVMDIVGIFNQEGLGPIKWWVG
jgi:DNA-directed RNA polymerase subunit E'/Rpb7